MNELFILEKSEYFLIYKFFDCKLKCFLNLEKLYKFKT